MGFHHLRRLDVRDADEDVQFGFPVPKEQIPDVIKQLQETGEFRWNVPWPSAKKVMRAINRAAGRCKATQELKAQVALDASKRG